MNVNEKKKKARLLLIKELTPETQERIRGGRAATAAASAQTLSTTIDE